MSTYIEIWLRVFVLVFGISNCVLTLDGARLISRGYYSPRVIQLAFIFFTNLTFAAFQVRWFFKDTSSTWAALLLTLSIVASVLGFFMYRNFVKSYTKSAADV